MVARAATHRNDGEKRGETTTRFLKGDATDEKVLLAFLFLVFPVPGSISANTTAAVLPSSALASDANSAAADASADAAVRHF